MKWKQHELGTELRLSAGIEGGGKRGSQYLFQFAYSSSLFYELPILSIQQIISPQQF